MDNEVVILHVCDSINEAYFLRSVLEGSGVEASIPDEHSTSYPPIRIAGVRLLVRMEEIARVQSSRASFGRTTRREFYVAFN